MATVLDPEQHSSEAISKPAATTQTTTPPLVSDAAESKPCEPEQPGFKVRRGNLSSACGILTRSPEGSHLHTFQATTQPSPTPPPLTSPWAQVVRSAAKSVAAQPAQPSAKSRPAQQQKRAPGAGRGYARDAHSNGQAFGPHSHGPRPSANHSNAGSAMHANEGRSITGSWRSGAHASSRPSAAGVAQANLPSQQPQQQSQQQPSADQEASKQQTDLQVHGKIEAPQQQTRAAQQQQQQQQTQTQIEKPSISSSNASDEHSDQLSLPSVKRQSPVDQQLPDQLSSTEVHASAGGIESNALHDEQIMAASSSPQQTAQGSNAPVSSTPDAHDEVSF